MPAAYKYFRTALRMLLPVLLPFALAGISYADDSDPAGRVARLAHVLGEVSIEPAGLDDWAVADLNRPLTTGDKIWSDKDSRVELSIGSAVVRLGSATGFSFLNLDDHAAQMQVTAGTASFHVRSMAENDTLEVDTPNIAVALLGPGDYRVEVNDAGDTSVVKVSGGSAEVTAGSQDYAVHLQQQITVNGTTEVSALTRSLGPPDAFDAWTMERDRRAQVAQVSNYVSPELVGAEDLDQNGTWQSTPNDGYVWTPNGVAADWAPYHDGHWIWIAPWGWTWIDAAAWGFAPFHYGRWATFGGRWCWVPGPIRMRAVYAPALVAWVSGARWGVAWFPLGPREVYVPAYPASQSYVKNVNITNTNVNNSYITSLYNHEVREIHYVNRNAPGAITAVSQATFTSAQPAGRNAVRLSREELAAATASTSTPAIVPARQSVLGAGATGVRVPRPPLALQNRLVLARTPPPSAPVPFDAQLQAIRANGGRPIARSELASQGIYAPAARIRMSAPASGAEARSGLSRAAGSGPAASHTRNDEPKPAWARAQPAATPTLSSASIVHAPIEPQHEAQPVRHSDRPPGAFGQPVNEERARTHDIPRPAEIASPVMQDLNRRVDRPSAPPVPVRVLAPPMPPPVPMAPPAPPSAPPVQVMKPAASEPKASSAGHAAPAEHSTWRGSN